MDVQALKPLGVRAITGRRADDGGRHVVGEGERLIAQLDRRSRELERVRCPVEERVPEWQCSST